MPATNFQQTPCPLNTHARVHPRKHAPKLLPEQQSPWELPCCHARGTPQLPAYTFTPGARRGLKARKLALIFLNEMFWHSCVFLNILSHVSIKIYAHNFIPLKFSVLTLWLLQVTEPINMWFWYMCLEEGKIRFLEMCRYTRTTGSLSSWRLQR